MKEFVQAPVSTCPMKQSVCDLVGYTHAKWIDLMVELAPLISAAAVCLGAVVALCTLAFVNRRTYLKSIDDDFARLDEFFWTNDRVALGRDLVTYEASFARVRYLLENMNSYDFTIGDKGQKYDESERSDIENINCFCACIARVHLLSEGRLSKRQRRMFNAMFGYWLMEIERRPALAAYYTRYWVAPVGEQKKSAFLTSMMLRQTPWQRLKSLSGRKRTRAGAAAI